MFFVWKQDWSVFERKMTNPDYSETKTLSVFEFLLQLLMD